MSDLIDRQAAIDAVVGCTNCGTEDVLRAYVVKHSLENGWTGGIVDALDAIEQLPSAQPEPHEIGYSECANAMLKMWIDNVLTDGEYNRIMDKLNAHWAERREE